jgi:hypothetical protein
LRFLTVGGFVFTCYRDTSPDNATEFMRGCNGTLFF